MSKLCQTLKASIFHEIRQSMAKSKHEFLKTYRLQQFGRSKTDFKSADNTIQYNTLFKVGNMLS